MQGHPARQRGLSLALATGAVACFRRARALALAGGCGRRCRLRLHPRCAARRDARLRRENWCDGGERWIGGGERRGRVDLRAGSDVSVAVGLDAEQLAETARLVLGEAER